MRVSVAMATYDGEPFLREQLDSIAAQTLTPHELVVSDDGSSDQTLSIISEFAVRASFPVRVVRNDRQLGYADNFLNAASLCAGDYIAFCDQDDVWVPTKLSVALSALRSAEASLIVHSAQVVDESLVRIGHPYPAITSKIVEPLESDPWLLLPGFCMVFASRLLTLGDIRERPQSGFGGHMSHDQWIYFLALVTDRVVFLSDCLALYRQHGSNTLGYPTKRLMQFAREILDADESTYARTAEVAAEWASLLQRIASEETDDLLKQRLLTGVEFYSLLNRRWVTRSRLYEPSASTRDRASRLGELVRSGAYSRRNRGGLGRRSLLKDAFVAATGW